MVHHVHRQGRFQYPLITLVPGALEGYFNCTQSFDVLETLHAPFSTDGIPMRTLPTHELNIEENAN